MKKYVEAGTVLGQVTRARAEEIVRELVSTGDVQREQAQEWVDNLVDRSRKTSEQILDMVRREVTAQLSKIDASALESLAGQVSDLLKRSADAGRSAAKDATASAKKALLVVPGVNASSASTALANSWGMLMPTLTTRPGRPPGSPAPRVSVGKAVGATLTFIL